MTSVKTLTLAAFMLATVTLSAQDGKPFSPDTQIKFLKSQRQIQQVQIQMADLQRQFDQLANSVKLLQTQMESDCVAAAAEAKVDLTKFTCDVDKLAFVPKVPAPAVPPAAPEK